MFKNEVKDMTIRELAQFIDVSPATISLVLNGKDGVAGDRAI